MLEIAGTMAVMAFSLGSLTPATDIGSGSRDIAVGIFLYKGSVTSVVNIGTLETFAVLVLFNGLSVTESFLELSLEL